MKATLLGAAGAIGHSIATAVRQRGESYRVVGRNPASLQQSFGSDPLAEIATWNPDDSSSIRAALRGTGTLIYLVGVPYDQFQLHPVLMQRTLEAAVAEGVERMVLIGTVYPYGRPHRRPVKEDHPREPHTFKGRMRKEQEDLLLAADAAGRIRGTILRLPDFYGPGVERSFLHSMFQAAAHGGKAKLVGPIDRPHEFVYVPDVGPVVLDLAARAGAYGRWWNLAGAGATSQRRLMEMAFAIAGRRPAFQVAGKTLLRLLGLRDPFLREMVEMHYLLTDPVLLDDGALDALLGGLAKTSYEEGVHRTLAAVRG